MSSQNPFVQMLQSVDVCFEATRGVKHAVFKGFIVISFALIIWTGIFTGIGFYFGSRNRDSVSDVGAATVQSVELDLLRSADRELATDLGRCRERLATCTETATSLRDVLAGQSETISELSTIIGRYFATVHRVCKVEGGDDLPLNSTDWCGDGSGSDSNSLGGCDVVE